MATTLAERMSNFSGSPTSALIAKVAELKRQGKDIISLNVGEPDFGTPDYIRVAGMKAIADNFTKYTPGNGAISGRDSPEQSSRICELDDIMAAEWLY